MDADDLVDWAKTTLPDLYDPGMFDFQEISDDVWEAVDTVIADTVAYLEDPAAATDILQETARDWFSQHHTTITEGIPSASAATLQALMAKPQTSQHSADWYAQRRNRLTASEFAQILDGRRGALLRSKVEPAPEGAPADRAPQAPVAIAQPDGEMNATSWGHRFEPVVRDILELESAGVGTVYDTLGRFTHAEIPWLSASPDGVVLSGPLAGRLVEIKSPKTRVPGTFVPDEYYVQMQIQMEVCGCDAVEFVEAQFAQRPVQLATTEEPASLSAEDLSALQAAPWKGRIEVYGFAESPDSWVYRYSRPVEDLEDLEETPAPPPPTDLPLLESSIWWLVGWHPRTVLRNAAWWAETGWPAAQLFWAEVQSLRESWRPPSNDADVIQHVGWAGTT